MSAFRYEIPISLTLVSPFATRGLVFDRASIDLPLARDQDGKNFILPGTLVTGVLRAALAHLATIATGDVKLGGQTRLLSQDIDDLFGRPSEADDEATQKGHQVSNKPHRAQLLVRDLVVEETANTLEKRQDYPRIQVDKDMGSVAEGFLQFVEMPFKIGQKVTFSGVADLRAGAVDADRAVNLLKKALALVPAVGAIKSAGFGRLADKDGCTVGAAQAVSSVSSGQTVPSGVPVEVTYTIDRPFLVGGRMASANLFRGSPVIPGAAIKGALAAALKDAGLITDAMNDLLAGMTIGHAFAQPLDTQGEPTAEPWRPLPLSLATMQPDNATTVLYDRLLTAENAPPPNRGRRTQTLMFAPDWKRTVRTAVNDYCRQDWELPGFDVRTRTAIDPDTGAAAYDAQSEAGQLFSYAAVKTNGYRWVGRIVLPDGADPALVDRVVAALEIGVVGFGKSGAILEAHVGEAKSDEVPAAGSFALTLMSPAVLNDLAALNAGRSLFNDYAAYWKVLGYKLVRFFASQELEGGYFALRYPPVPGSCSSYLLTQPGSAFLVKPEDGARPIGELLTYGLPPNPWLGTRTWETSPFLRENGFGEVRLNAVDHVGLQAGVNLAAQGRRAA